MYGKKMEEKRAYLTVKDLMERFNVTRQTIFNWTKGGLLKGYRIASKIFYKPEDVDKSLVDVNEYRRLRNNGEDYQGTNHIPYYKMKKLNSIVKKFFSIIKKDRFKDNKK